MGTVGMFGGCAFALVFGIYVATTFTAADMDWVSGLIQNSPTWYGLMILLVGLVGGVAQGALCVYGTGLDLSSLLSRLSRVWSTALLGAVVTLFVFVGSLAISLLDFVTAFILVLIVVTAPWVVINLIGHALCRGSYDVHDLQVLTGDPRVRGGSYWYWRGWSIPAALAWLVSTAFGLLCVNTTLFVGPLANIAGGVDISFIASGLLGGALYLALRAVIPSHRPGTSIFSPRLADEPVAERVAPSLNTPPTTA
jgi:purine-cytosine permease-like protein